MDKIPTKQKRLPNFPQLFESTGFWKGAALILFAIIVLTQFVDISITPRISFLKNFSSSRRSKKTQQSPAQSAKVDTAALARVVIAKEGVILPISWGDLGKRMIADGVIDEQKFRALFEGGMTNSEEQIFTGNVDKPIVMTQENSRFMIDMLWAFGLSNKNEILQEEMMDQKYGGDASKFASTGGWSLAKGATMDHYGKHPYAVLTKEQQALVDKVSKTIYRPCCGNTAHFPDCNHGMAMLGLLELMAANNTSEEQMYQVALKANSLWFPQTYIDLATYFKEQGQDWDQVDPKVVLSADYSSARGYQTTRQRIQSLPKPQRGGGGCGA